MEQTRGEAEGRLESGELQAGGSEADRLEVVRHLTKVRHEISTGEERLVNVKKRLEPGTNINQ